VLSKLISARAEGCTRREKTKYSSMEDTSSGTIDDQGPRKGREGNRTQKGRQGAKKESAGTPSLKLRRPNLLEGQDCREEDSQGRKPEGKEKKHARGIGGLEGRENHSTTRELGTEREAPGGHGKPNRCAVERFKPRERQ